MPDDTPLFSVLHSDAPMASLHPNPSAPQELQFCGICGESYDDNTHQAKFLTCFHTFCSHCLEKLSNRAQINPTIIQCPNCRSDTQLPDNGIGGLQTNFYVTSFQEFSKDIETPSAIANFQGCHGHSKQPISYFCLTCEIAVCNECLTENHTAENKHSVIKISKSEITYLQELNISHTSLTQNKRKLEHMKSEMSLLNAAKETALKEMDIFIKHAHEQLEQHRNELNCQILDQFNAKQNVLLDKQNQIQKAIKLINKNKAQAKFFTKTGDVGKLKPICESLKEVNEKTESIFSKMDLGENYFVFARNKGWDGFKEFLSTLSGIHCKGFLPAKMRFNDLEAKAGGKSVLTVEVHNHHGDKLTMSSGNFSVQVTDDTGTEIHTELCTAGPDWTITFTPQMCGLHKISGSFLSTQLISEPTHISVSSNNPVLKFGEEGNGNGTFKHPLNIAIDNNNDCLYVVDYKNSLIQKFSGNGDFLSQFNLNGHNKDCTTFDVALDLNNGLIYWADIVLQNDADYTTGNNMLVFNFDGELQHIHNLSEMSTRTSIAINSQDDLVIVDFTKKCLSKVDKVGNHLCHMGKFKEPSNITVDDDDSIIVSDFGDDCIYIFNPDTTIRHRFGSSGTGKGQLKKPVGVATDGEYILVAEGGNNRVQVFTCDGTFVSMIESKDDPLVHPHGLAVTNDGHVYVGDRGNHCIKKYRYKCMP